MAFDLQHFPEQHLIIIRVSGIVSLEENLEIGLRLQTVLQQTETTTDIFFDLRTLDRFPTSLKQLRSSSAVIRNPNLGWIVLLTGNKPLLKLIATALIQLQTSTGRIRVFDTLENAINFFQETSPGSRERSFWFKELQKKLT